jgi:succinylarginine dihydrolase
MPMDSPDRFWDAAQEVNFDGLVGPTHNYAGLSLGNVASASNAGLISRPKEAALQGLAKMRRLAELVGAQGILPPPRRPYWPLLEDVGYQGRTAKTLKRVAAEQPGLLACALSASSMWAANAATISPSADTADGKLHITVANLSSMLHRSIESEATYKLFRLMFGQAANVVVHRALPAHSDFSDEGAANHTHLAARFGAPGLEVFVYGRQPGEPAATTRFPARQSRAAGEAIARSHGLDPARVVHLRQSRLAIDAGAFHNDVVAVGSLDTLFYHEHAFAAGSEAAQSAVRAASDGLFEPQFVCVPNREVPLADAIRSYLFNSQLVATRDAKRGLTLIAPLEVAETPSTAAYVQRMLAEGGPIRALQYLDLRQSMRNGGGPACLRLRIVLTEEQAKAVHPAFRATPERLARVEAAVEQHYPETLRLEDLAEPALLDQFDRAYGALAEAFGLPASFYGL